MINYYCPNFLDGRIIYDELIYGMQTYPEFFYPNINIKSIFGTFPGCIWNGGGVVNTHVTNYDEILDTCAYYDLINIPLQLTFTNPLIEEQDCYDRLGNKILELLHTGKNEVLISSPILEEYIKSEYPLYKINRSIINTKEDYNYEKALKKQYNNIVLPRRYVKDINFLQKINSKYRNRIELLCNDPCPIDCPNLYSHYERYADITLFNTSPHSLINDCTNEKRCNNYLYVIQEDQITYNDIINTYLPLGYTEFKLAGRSNCYTIITSIVPFLVKPEYQMNMVSKLLHLI